MANKVLSGGAIANMQRKQTRINIAINILTTLHLKTKFISKTAIFTFIAEMINNHEKLTNTQTKKGPCSRSGVYSVPEINLAVEKFWITGILESSDVDLHQSAEAAAQKALMDKDLEISNLQNELSEKSYFLAEADQTIEKLKVFIKSQDLTTKNILDKPTSSQTENNDTERQIEELCQVIYKLELWADNMVERQPNGSIIDATNDAEIVSSSLMQEYHKRVGLDKLGDVL